MHATLAITRFPGVPAYESVNGDDPVPDRSATVWSLFASRVIAQDAPVMASVRPAGKVSENAVVVELFFSLNVLACMLNAPETTAAPLRIRLPDSVQFAAMVKVRADEEPMFKSTHETVPVPVMVNGPAVKVTLPEIVMLFPAVAIVPLLDNAKLAIEVAADSVNVMPAMVTAPSESWPDPVKVRLPLIEDVVQVNVDVPHAMVPVPVEFFVSVVQVRLPPRVSVTAALIFTAASAVDPQFCRVKPAAAIVVAPDTARL